MEEYQSMELLHYVGRKFYVLNSNCLRVSHLGPMGPSTLDVAVGYAIMSGKDEKDSSTLVQPPVHLSDFDKEDLSDLKIGVFTQWNEDADKEVVQVCNSILFKILKLRLTFVDLFHFSQSSSTYVSNSCKGVKNVVDLLKKKGASVIEIEIPHLSALNKVKYPLESKINILGTCYFNIIRNGFQYGSIYEVR